jgi:hypothetical protein
MMAPRRKGGPVGTVQPGVEPDRAARERARIRDAVFGHYGRACTCCGATEDLTIDHANGGGGEERRRGGLRGYRLYALLIATGFPDGFATMCNPCNGSKGDGPACRLHAERSPR